MNLLFPPFALKIVLFVNENKKPSKQFSLRILLFHRLCQRIEGLFSEESVEIRSEKAQFQS